ncbi:MAG: hypothetical protein IKO03_16275 [Lachnospiraceae bacterium]|nr:hypothetical protein [Lachnospiraceae bacterium]
MRGLFPGYDLMIKVPHYSFLKGRRFLLSAAWIYRMGRTIMRKETGGKVNAVVKRSFVSKRKAQEREETLKRWGL